MDKNNNTLGGFETILDGIMPTDPTKEPTKFGFDEGADELSDDEIEALKGKRAPSVNDVKGIKDDKKKQVDNDDDDDEEDDEVKSKVEVTKKAKAKKVEELEETEELLEHLTDYQPQHFNLPTMIVHGEQDNVVNSSNAQQLATQFLHLNDMPIDTEPSMSQRYAQTSREYTHKTYKYKRQTVVELVEVKHLDHAWSGGDESLAYNSRKGPNSSKLIWNFFKRCARQYDVRKIEQEPLPDID